jgi:hypothetical protein
VNDVNNATWERLSDLLNMEDRQAAFILLTKAYVASAAEQRTKLCEMWPFGRVWKFPPADTLTFRNGERFPPKDRIVSALIGYTLAPEIRCPDYRDTMVALAWIYHAAALVGEDPNALFREIAAISDPTVGMWLTDFANRKPADKSMEAFCLKSYVSSTGEVGLQGGW